MPIKLTPEFMYVNKNMTLEEFKYIFWWEWFHRFFARLIGIVFIFPFFYFLLKKYLNSFFYKRFAIIFSLGLLQATVGWWMVKSGLSKRSLCKPLSSNISPIKCSYYLCITTLDKHWILSFKKCKFYKL